MIVEKSEKPLWLVKKLLSTINFEVCFATGNGYEAIEKYDTVKPDLVLLDLHLSKNDGFTVLKEIKKIHPESQIIIIAATLDDKVFQDCMNLGALACLLIPFNLKDFVSLVTSLNYVPYTQTKEAPIIKDKVV